jgi:hypothetical protein
MTGVVGSDSEVVDGTMSPVADTFVAYGTDERFEILKTDGTGALRVVSVADGKLRTFQPFNVSLTHAEKSCANKRLFILPDHVVRDSWLLQKGKGATASGPKPGSEFLRKWAKKLSAESDIAVTPAIKRFGVAQLMKPDKSQHAQPYAAFYQALKRDNCPCLFIPRTRVLVARCSQPALKSKTNIELQIVFPSGAPQEVELPLEEPDNAPSYHMAMFVADQASLPEGHNTLPEGVYTFTIRATDLNQDLAWCEHVKRNGLVIQAYVSFNIRTVTTEMAVVHLDPVSLEDALLAQFPERLGKEMANALDADTNDSAASRALRVLGNWREKAEWVKNTYTLGNQLHKPGGFYGKATSLVRFGVRHGQEQGFPPWFLDSFKLATGGVDYAKQYYDFLHDADNLEAIRDGLDAFGSTKIKDAGTRALNVLKERVDFKSDLYTWSLLSEGVKARGEYAILDIALDVSVSGPRARRFFYPPAAPGKPSPDRRAEIPLWFNLHNATIGQSQELLDLQNRMYGDLNFIKHDSYSAPEQPSLVRDTSGLHIVGVFLKDGNSWRYYDERKAELRQGDGAGKAGYDFSWAGPFEMVVLAAVEGVNEELRESTHHSWRRVPLKLSWEQRLSGGWDMLTGPLNSLFGTKCDINDQAGPSYSSAFHYVAYWVDKQGYGRRGRGLHWDGLEDNEMPDHDAIDSPEVRQILERYILSRFLEPDSSSGWLYLGHFRFSYEAPNGTLIDGLRPFGQIKRDATFVDYSFGLTDVPSGSSTEAQLTLRLPSPLKATLPAGLSPADLTEAWLDTSKADLAYLSLTREMAQNVGPS